MTRRRLRPVPGGQALEQCGTRRSGETFTRAAQSRPALPAAVDMRRCLAPSLPRARARNGPPRAHAANLAAQSVRPASPALRFSAPRSSPSGRADWLPQRIRTMTEVRAQQPRQANPCGGWSRDRPLRPYGRITLRECDVKWLSGGIRPPFLDATGFHHSARMRAATVLTTFR